MDVVDPTTGDSDPSDRTGDSTPCRAPSHNQEVGVVPRTLLQFCIGHWDRRYAVVAQADHVLVVVGVITDVARAVLLLDTPNTVHEVRSTGQGDRPVSILTSQVRPERAVAVLVHHVELRGVPDLNGRQVVDLRQSPRLRTVSQVAIGQEHHRGLVDQGDPSSLDGHVKAVRRGPGCHNGHRRLPMTSVHSHQ